MLFPTFLFQNPGAIRHRRLVSHMLAMATLEISHPVTKFIQMISNNRLMHPQTSLLSSFWTPARYATLARMLTRTEEPS